MRLSVTKNPSSRVLTATALTATPAAQTATSAAQTATATAGVAQTQAATATSTAQTVTPAAQTASAAVWQTSTAVAQTATAAAWTETPTSTPKPSGPSIVYLPLILNRLLPPIQESEPNNFFGETDLIEILPVTILSHHDGAADSGDVFLLDDDLVSAGNIVEASIDTDDPAGLQLIAYDAQGSEITRDYEQDYRISFIAPTGGAYYIYVFTDPQADNTAAYQLTIKVLP